MRTYTLGEGTPEVAVVGGVHGDEPCGVVAIERLVAADPPVERPVKLVVANEAALDRGVRFLDVDLNRAFDGEADAGPNGPHEAALARLLADELRGLTALSLHSTRSHAEPFAVVGDTTGRASDVVARLPVAAAVDVGDRPEGRPFAVEATSLVEVECGLQGTPEAADNAERVVRAFLGATGVLPPAPEPRSLPVYRMGDPVPKPAAASYEVSVENFRRVEPGETYARADDRRFVADDPFVPVLFSADGYDGIFGYAGERAGAIEPGD
jgi:succinylglutamate desuccinylase